MTGAVIPTNQLSMSRRSAADKQTGWSPGRDQTSRPGDVNDQAWNNGDF